MLYRFRTLTAWLGMLTIWFAIAAPLVSQARVRASALPDAAICSAEHGGATHGGAAHHALHLDACGYCGFFAHTPALGGAASDWRAAAPPDAAEAPVRLAAAPRAGRYPRAYPRAPPQDA
ncbi:DUF2946 domain-containing protein [Burkholderia alba]|uniref:DUF2946 domain-containing protein n=1 Tax=Burkholderia alba TaxID=2683677 RepID=UPI002B051978|nr:DUF2946 domain-containing protein [Burkholderia alba]